MKTQKDVFAELSENHGKNRQAKRYSVSKGKIVGEDCSVLFYEKEDGGIVSVALVIRQQGGRKPGLWIAVKDDYQNYRNNKNGAPRSAGDVAEEVGKSSLDGGIEALTATEPLVRGDEAIVFYETATFKPQLMLSHFAAQLGLYVRS